MAARRPLLLKGKSGIGKSSVAYGIAEFKGWHAEEVKINSRMSGEDLKYTFDAVRRLSIAQALPLGSDLPDEVNFVSPGAAWRTSNPKYAADKLRLTQEANAELYKIAKFDGRVLLVDEIDKGDLSFANDLLDVFEERSKGFKIERFGLNLLPDDKEYFVVITSNDERDLPDAFVRRCFYYEMKPPEINCSETIGAVRQRHRMGKGKSVLGRGQLLEICLLYTSPSPRDATLSRMPSSA